MSATIYTSNVFERLEHGVAEFDIEQVRQAAGDIGRHGITASDAILNGLGPGLERAGQLYDDWEYFLPELVLAADAAALGLEILWPRVKPGEISGWGKGILVLTATADKAEMLSQRICEAASGLADFSIIEIPAACREEDIIALLAMDMDVVAVSPVVANRVANLLMLARSIRDRAPAAVILAGGGKIGPEREDMTAADLEGGGTGNPIREAIRFVAHLRRMKTSGV